MDCSQLDRESHAVMLALHELGGPRKKINRYKGVRMFRATPTQVADHLGKGRNYVRELLVGLEDLGFVTLFFQDGTVGEGEGTCTCLARRASVGPTTTSNLTRSKRSGVEGGKREESEGPEAPYRRNARETRYGSKSELDRQKRRERLELIEQKRPEELNSNDLTTLFWDRIKRHSPWASRIPGAVNHTALARNFAEWIREGTPPELIREMIEVFAKDTRFIADGDVAWKVFINKRALVAQRAANRVRSRSSDDDDLGWGSPYDEDDDDDLGWGESMRITNPEYFDGEPSS